MTSADLAALLARIREAKGVDRELDKAIMAACFEWAQPVLPYYHPQCIGEEPIYWHAPEPYRKRACPPLTASVDSALALIEAKLPGCAPSIGQNVHYRHWHGYILEAEGGDPVTIGAGISATPALALLEALVSALIEEQGDG